MINFLEETKSKIEEAGCSTDDIIFIGSEKSGHSCTWDEFCAFANVAYDNSYGRVEVATDLTIVFKNKTRLVREEYDGSEWWEIIKPFKMPKATYKIDNLFRAFAKRTYEETLAELELDPQKCVGIIIRPWSESKEITKTPETPETL